MKLIVLISFIDKTDLSKEYKPGDVINISDKLRIEDLVSRGLVEAYEDKEEKSESTEEKKVSKKVSK